MTAENRPKHWPWTWILGSYLIGIFFVALICANWFWQKAIHPKLLQPAQELKFMAQITTARLQQLHDAQAAIDR